MSRYVDKFQHNALRQHLTEVLEERDQLKLEAVAWKQAYEAHLETVYVLWDNALIEHSDQCAARPEEDDDDIDDDSCDCGAVAAVNGDHFKAAVKLAEDREGS